jgi:hypothetical protein
MWTTSSGDLDWIDLALGRNTPCIPPYSLTAVVREDGYFERKLD